MIQRALTTVIAVPLVLSLLWLGGLWWVLFILLVALLGGHELFSLLQKGGYRPARLLGLLWIALLILGNWPPLAIPLTATISAGMILTLTYALFQVEQPLLFWLSTAAGALYIGVMLGQAAAVRLVDHGFHWTMLAVLLPWGNDTLAYVVGINLGKHKLWPRLSPKKSWEGTVGGTVGAMLVGALIATYSPLPLSTFQGALLGLAVSALALFGDLAISMLKRQAGVKDSGILFPGHGGMLDRLDSMLFVAPFIYQIAQLVQ